MSEFTPLGRIGLDPPHSIVPWVLFLSVVRSYMDASSHRIFSLQSENNS